jgi:hypothetical protein
MPRFSQCCGVVFLTVVCCCSEQTAYSQKRPAAGPGKPTHVVQPALLEVAPTRADGNPWDTGIGAFARPDLQVTLMRHDEKAWQMATELLMQATERQMKELGQPVPPKFRELFARNAVVSLRCGASIAAHQDQQLKDARAKFAADTTVASDSLLTKLVDGGLQVALGDRVSVFVNDIDLAAHDLLGQTDLEMTKELLAKGELELKFNSVESLRLKIAPIPK